MPKWWLIHLCWTGSSQHLEAWTDRSRCQGLPRGCIFSIHHVLGRACIAMQCFGEMEVQLTIPQRPKMTDKLPPRAGDVILVLQNQMSSNAAWRNGRLDALFHWLNDTERTMKEFDWLGFMISSSHFEVVFFFLCDTTVLFWYSSKCSSYWFMRGLRFADDFIFIYSFYVLYRYLENSTAH